MNRDGNRLLADYCDHRYGKAGKLIAQYFVTMEPVVTECPTLAVTKPKPLAKVVELQQGAKKARGLLMGAQTALRDDPVKLATARLLEKNLQYTEGDLDICRLTLLNDTENLKKRAEEMKQLLLDNQDKGVFLVLNRE